MDDRANELFLLDAEQAVREIAQYGSGQASWQAQRVGATFDYLFTVLQSLGSVEHAAFCEQFAKAFEVLEEGQARRLARDFVELARLQFDAIRANDELPDQREEISRLLAKLPNSAALSPSPSAALGPRLFENAARAIAAVDELAHQLQAGLHRPDPEQTAISLSKDPDLPVPLQAPEIEAADRSESKAINDPTGFGPTSIEFSGIRIDQAFRRALKLTESGPWHTGVGALFEAIDDLDHLPLSALSTADLSWTGGASIRVQADLVIALAQLIRERQLVGQVDAMLVAHTLFLSFYLGSPLPKEPLAKLAGRFGGRVETDAVQGVVRLVIPASSRLLRVVTLSIEDQWVAVSWSQFLSADAEKPMYPLTLQNHPSDDEGRRFYVRLAFGDEADRLVVREVGPVVVGVRFDIPRQLRRRGRYRGLVMIPDGRLLPVYG